MRGVFERKERTSLGSLRHERTHQDTRIAQLVRVGQRMATHRDHCNQGESVFGKSERHLAITFPLPNMAIKLAFAINQPKHFR